jgi:hypothetical protein
MRALSTSSLRSTGVYPNFRAVQACAVLFAALPLLYLIRMCVVHYVDVPLWDAWELVPRLDHLYSGGFTFNDLWRQHNEHRPLIPIAVMLTLARLTRWNTSWEIVVNVIVGVGIFGVFGAYLRTAWRAHGGAPVWLLPLFSVLVFSPVQWENWMWGWQMQVLMCALATLLASYWISRSAHRPDGFAGAVVCGVAATYCFAAGLAVWPVQAVGILLAGGPRRTRRLMWWLAIATLTCASYFYHYQRPPQPSMASNFASFAAARVFVLYLCTCLGYPIAAYDRVTAAILGVLALAAFAALTVRLRARRDDPVYLFPVLIGGQAIATAIASGLGRAWMGVDQALTSRYTTLTLPLWCAVAALAVLWVRSRVAAGARSPLPNLAVVSLLLVMLASAIVSTRDAVHTVAGRSETFMFARRGLIVGRSNAMLRVLYPNPEVERAYRGILLRLRLSVFRPALQPTYPAPVE